MSKLGSAVQIIIGILLAYVGVPSQSTILVYLCQQEANLGWLSMDFCMLSKYVLFILGLLAILFGIIGLIAPQKK
jgi:hypothetical protein